MASNNDIEKDTFADNPELEARFNLAAQGLAETYGLDLADLKAAYRKKPESLISHFNTAGNARSERNGWIGWSVFWVIVCAPIAIYTAYRAIDEQMKAIKTEDQLEAEIQLQKMLPGPSQK